MLWIGEQSELLRAGFQSLGGDPNQAHRAEITGPLVKKRSAGFPEVAGDVGRFAQGAGTRDRLEIAEAVFGALDNAIGLESRVYDGDDISAGDEFAKIEGPAAALLTGERTALNIMQRLSGVATLTRATGGRNTLQGCVSESIFLSLPPERCRIYAQNRGCFIQIFRDAQHFDDMLVLHFVE